MVAIQVDTSGLTFPLYLIPGHTPDFVDGSVSPPPSVDLAPDTYRFQQISGVLADFQFQVTQAGTVDYDAAFDGFLSGRGTSNLVVTGFSVTVDGTALSHGLFPVIAGARTFLMPDTAHELRLVPASHYAFQPTSGIVADFFFAVTVDGGVVVPAQFAGFASAAGDRLTVRGYDVEVDGRSLSHDLLPLIVRLRNDFLPRDRVNTLTLLPAAGYGFQPGSGIVGDFTFSLRGDGTVDFPPSCDGFLSGRGSSTLTVGGFPVLVDATHADTELLSIANVGLLAQTPRFLFGVLVPCPGYVPQTRNGVFSHGFSVERDGSVTVDPSVAGRLVVTTVPRVQIIGATPI